MNPKCLGKDFPDTFSARNADALLLVFVLGVTAIALGTDIAAAIGWLRRRWQ
jgi:hypothetical protein